MGPPLIASLGVPFRGHASRGMVDPRPGTASRSPGLDVPRPGTGIPCPGLDFRAPGCAKAPISPKWGETEKNAKMRKVMNFSENGGISRNSQNYCNFRENDMKYLVKSIGVGLLFGLGRNIMQFHIILVKMGECHGF